MPDTGNKIQSLSGQYTYEQIEKTARRYASISFGIYWSAHKSLDEARTFASFSLAVLMYHLGIPRQLQVEEIIVDVLNEEWKTYYTKTGSMREVPLEEQYVRFAQTDMPNW